MSTTLPTTGATKQDDDDVAEVTTDIAIDNTDLTSLAGDWFSKLVLVTGNVQITNNAALSTMDASFQKLDTVSGNLDIFGNDLLFGCARLGVPAPRRRGGWGLVTLYVSIYTNLSCAALARLGVPRPRHDNRTLQHIRRCHVGHALAMAFDDLVTVTGYLSIYDSSR